MGRVAAVALACIVTYQAFLVGEAALDGRRSLFQATNDGSNGVSVQSVDTVPAVTAEPVTDSSVSNCHCNLLKPAHHTKNEALQ